LAIPNAAGDIMAPAKPPTLSSMSIRRPRSLASAGFDMASAAATIVAVVANFMV
jgi:hypothetical protein